ncbi:hypothetical protein [Parabacteroides sp. PF5-9]|nr:hypothetical protein [Parabacteroides sp. PF5-9]MDH6357137.1 antitoxin (DNA-binding transcriptional repressor) of toxin-antitoxin stability system [Parabacteroides sp. PF5-9]
MKTITSTDFFRKTNYYLKEINKGEKVIIRRRSGEMFTLIPILLEAKEEK